MTVITTAIEAKLDGVNWTDITSDVIKPIRYSGGIFGNSPTDRLASTGECSFDLRNDAGNSGGLIGYYTPGHTNCRAGFGVGLVIRVRHTLDGVTRTKWYGRIPKDGISVIPGTTRERRVSVTARDWFEQAANHEMVSPAFAQNKTEPEVAALILANMNIPPLSTDYRTGTDTFDTVFDTVRATTRAMSELYKVVISEMGYAYIVHNGASDEVLRVEGRYTRNDERPEPTDVPAPKSLSSYIVDESGNYLVDESGNYIVGNDMMDVTFDNTQIDAETSDGANMYNRVKITTFPRRVDASPVTLATVQKSIYVGAGGTATITLRYKDPSGIASSVSGINMIDPVATTDYLANTLENGGGTNLTASFTVTKTDGTGDVTLTIANNSASAGYLLAGSKVRGTGVYIDDPIDIIAEDTTSIDNNGPYQLAVEMKYQDNTVADALAPLLLEQYKDARLELVSVTYCANSSYVNAFGFFYLECGDRLNISEDVTGTGGDYFIQGYEAEIQPGDVIFFKYYVKDSGYDALNFFILDDSELDSDYLLGL